MNMEFIYHTTVSMLRQQIYVNLKFVANMKFAEKKQNFVDIKQVSRKQETNERKYLTKYKNNIMHAELTYIGHGTFCLAKLFGFARMDTAMPQCSRQGSQPMQVLYLRNKFYISLCLYMRWTFPLNARSRQDHCLLASFTFLVHYENQSLHHGQTDDLLCLCYTTVVGSLLFLGLTWIEWTRQARTIPCGTHLALKTILHSNGVISLHFSFDLHMLLIISHPSFPKEVFFKCMAMIKERPPLPITEGGCSTYYSTVKILLL